jgi:cell wall-associated NlpC family hydrolase
MWYNKYTGIRFKHLGDTPESGLDCYNLCRYVYKEELAISIPQASHEFCNIVDDDWYLKTTENLFENGAKSSCWEPVKELKPFDIILMSFGSTNITNHCALYLGSNKILQIMINKPSWVCTYGKYYKQYSTGNYRWKNLVN